MPILPGFNGATTIQLWKRPQCGAKLWLVQGFNGATTIQLWKPNLSILHPSCNISFNGATTIQLWKLSEIYTIHWIPILASMEPQQFSCGNF